MFHQNRTTGVLGVTETHILAECDSTVPSVRPATLETRFDREVLSGKTCSHKALKKQGTRAGEGAYYIDCGAVSLFMRYCSNKHVP